MSKYKVGMVSLGCDKNRVDSELILGAINKHYEITNDAKEADIIIVNTCGFIESAKQESIDTILEMAEYKNKYNCKMLIATGCLTQRYGDELLELIPEIDILMGVNDYMKLHRLILDFIKEHKRISSASYTDDIYGKRMLHDLVRKISLIEGVQWIRLLYCYPEEITDELIEEIANNDKVVKYLDLPIQYISSSVLKQMGRRTNKENIISKIETLRNKVPNIALRTSLIVGFPNESEHDFNELATFLIDYKLENVGVFSYSQEEDTPAAKMDGQIEEEIKIERKNKLMSIQRDVVKEQIKLKIGNIYDTIIDSNNGEYFIGRSYEMAPEIDGLIYIKKHKGINIGDIIKVKITDVMEYDLIGEIFDEFSK